MISVEHIVKAFGGLRAVDDCSFRIAKGAITGLIGPNGAGKTTLFNIVAGALKPDSGHVRLGGRDVTGLKPHRLFRQGLVRTFQIPRELDNMSVRENLMVVPAGQRGENLFTAWLAWGRVKRQERALRHQAEAVLDLLELSHLAEERAGNLSGGQKKLLELGRAMMSQARVFLLDEPGAGVNPTLMTRLRDNIRRLNEEGRTFCIIEHDLDLIAELCNPVVVMCEGSVLAQGTMEEIRRNRAVIEAYLGGAAAA